MNERLHGIPNHVGTTVGRMHSQLSINGDQSFIGSFREFVAEQEKTYNEATITVNGEELLIKDIPDRSFTMEQYRQSRANSIGWKLIISKLDAEAIVHVTEHYLRNCRREDDLIYDGALKNNVLPELLKRIKEREQADKGEDISHQVERETL
jgi:hypothetical protein